MDIIWKSREANLKLNLNSINCSFSLHCYYTSKYNISPKMTNICLKDTINELVWSYIGN